MGFCAFDMNPVPRFHTGCSPSLPGQESAGSQLAGPTRHFAVFADRVENDKAMRILPLEFGHRALKGDGLALSATIELYCRSVFGVSGLGPGFHPISARDQLARQVRSRQKL